jgi:ABC-type proline/glycine betaine transport system substrate-binding protein
MFCFYRNSVVAQIVNEILRDLGYAVDRQTLSQAIAQR